MSVKILGGILKGLALYVENQEKTRPTSILLKRKVFDFRQNWSDFSFCDLCAGTGSVGIESWSRGAVRLLCIDVDIKTIRGLTKNFQLINEKYHQEFLARKLSSVKLDAIIFLKNLEKYNREYSFSSEPWVLFIDPPYESLAVYEALKDALLRSSYFSEVWIESDSLKGSSKESWPSVLGDYYLGRNYGHGDHYIIQYVRN